MTNKIQLSKLVNTYQSEYMNTVEWQKVSPAIARAAFLRYCARHDAWMEYMDTFNRQIEDVAQQLTVNLWEFYQENEFNLDIVKYVMMSCAYQAIRQTISRKSTEKKVPDSQKDHVFMTIAQEEKETIDLSAVEYLYRKLNSQKQRKRLTLIMQSIMNDEQLDTSDRVWLSRLRKQIEQGL